MFPPFIYALIAAINYYVFIAVLGDSHVRRLLIQSRLRDYMYPSSRKRNLGNVYSRRWHKDLFAVHNHIVILGVGSNELNRITNKATKPAECFCQIPD